MVGVPGFEPGTSSLSEKRSNQLSYTPMTYGDYKSKKEIATQFIEFFLLLLVFEYFRFESVENYISFSELFCIEFYFLNRVMIEFFSWEGRAEHVW